MNQATTVPLWPAQAIPEHDSGMTILAKNLKFLMDDQGLSPRDVQKRCPGVSQPTIHRILTVDGYLPRVAAIDNLAEFFGVTAHDLRFTDLEKADDIGDDRRHQLKASVRIRPLAGFGVKGTGIDRLTPFEFLDVSMDWFLANLGNDPDHCRFAVMRDDSMRGEIEMGDVVFIDTSIDSVEQGGDGIYAFTYFGISHIKYGQRPKLGELIFKGTKPFLDSIPIEEDEFDGLQIHGRVKAKLSLTKF